MAEFCTKCFSALNDKGQCPVCDARAIAAASVVPEIPEIPDIPDIPDVPMAPAVPAYDEDATQRVRQAAPVASVASAVPAASVPKFCMKCGNGLDENGKCPVCDAPPVPPAPRFCLKCGNGLDENGKCPVCDAPPAAPVLKFCLKCGNGLDENGKCPVCDAPPVSMASLSDMAQTAVAVEEAPPAKKESKSVTALSVIATVLLSICLFVTMLLSVSVLTVRTTVSKGGVAKVANNLDMPKLLKSVGSAGDAEFDQIYSFFYDAYGIEMDEEKLGELLEKSTVPQYISEKVGGFTDDFFAGKAELVVTREELEDLVAENENLIEKEMPEDYELTKADHKRIAGWMIKNGEDEVRIIATEDLQDQAPVVYQTVNIGLSWVAFTFFMLLSALIAFVMCRNSLSQAAIGGGVVCILLGGVTTLAAALALIPGLWSSVFGDKLAWNVVGAVLEANILIFGLLLFLGIALLVTRTVVKFVKSKKE